MEAKNENRSKEREKLIQRLISLGYLSQKKVIEAMRKVPRDEFIPSSQKKNAYADRPLEIGFGQTISAPHMVAIMTEALDVQKKNKILEVGTGSGYQAAILSELAPQGEIYTIEKIPKLKEMAKKNLLKLGYKNIFFIEGDGTLGYEKKAPYDRIIVTAGSPKIPSALINQLNAPGKLLIPVGGRISQDLILVEKNKEGERQQKNLGGCVFVPLIGKEGW